MVKYGKSKYLTSCKRLTMSKTKYIDFGASLQAPAVTAPGSCMFDCEQWAPHQCFKQICLMRSPRIFTHDQLVYLDRFTCFFLLQLLEADLHS